MLFTILKWCKVNFIRYNLYMSVLHIHIHAHTQKMYAFLNLKLFVSKDNNQSKMQLSDYTCLKNSIEWMLQKTIHYFFFQNKCCIRSVWMIRSKTQQSIQKCHIFWAKTETRQNRFCFFTLRVLIAYAMFHPWIQNMNSHSQPYNNYKYRNIVISW